MKCSLLLLLLLLALGMTSCKEWQIQYPEDTERTKLTPYERIKGKWILTSVTLNNKEYIDTITAKLGSTFFYCSDEHISGGARDADYYISLPSSSKYAAVYSFNNEHTRLAVLFQSSDLNLYMDQMVLGLFRYDERWEILKLSQHELKVRRVVQDSTMVNVFIKN
jgi:hypothetical protein